MDFRFLLFCRLEKQKNERDCSDLSVPDDEVYLPKAERKGFIHQTGCCFFRVLSTHEWVV